MQLGNHIDIKKYQRFFAFGCSFTWGGWITWADILGNQIPTYYNYGKPGGGNAYIFSQIVEAHIRYGFRESDLVMVMWSTNNREDRYFNNQWHGKGNIFSQDLLPKEFVEKFADSRGYLIRDFANFTATQALLDSTNCDWDFSSIRNMYKDACEEDHDIFELYSDTYKKFKQDLSTTVFADITTYPTHKKGYDMNYVLSDAEFITVKGSDGNVFIDPHPTPLHYYTYLSKTYNIENERADIQYWVTQSYQDLIDNSPVDIKRFGFPKRLMIERL